MEKDSIVAWSLQSHGHPEEDFRKMQVQIQSQIGQFTGWDGGQR